MLVRMGGAEYNVGKDGSGLNTMLVRMGGGLSTMMVRMGGGAEYNVKDG